MNKKRWCTYENKMCRYCSSNEILCNFEERTGGSYVDCPYAEVPNGKVEFVKINDLVYIGIVTNIKLADDKNLQRFVKKEYNISCQIEVTLTSTYIYTIVKLESRLAFPISNDMLEVIRDYILK